VRDGAIVVIDVAKEQVGADIAAMLGGTLINLLALAVGQQAALEPHQRRHVALLVDEFHALPAANYEAFLAELAKYGASLVLATQSLGALDEVDPGRGLRHAVFANTDHLFAFNCSAADATLLAPELGAPLEPADLVELGAYQCYSRLSHAGERLPAFHLRLDAPPQGDADVREMLAACSAVKYGRDFLAVAADRAALLALIESPDEHDERDGQTGRSKVDPENGHLQPASSADTAGARPRVRRHQGRRPAAARDTRADSPEPQFPLDLDQGPGQAEDQGDTDAAAGDSVLA